MQLHQQELANDIMKVTLVGALDIAGVDVVDLPLNALAGSRNKLLIDFAQVDFLGSIGIRTLVQVARSVGQRGGTVVVMNPNEAARRVLEYTGVDTLLVLADGEDAALAAFG